MSLSELQQTHRNQVKQLARPEDDHRLWGVGTEPKFGIGQRAILVQTPGGNLLWDCLSLVDDETVAALQRLGWVGGWRLASSPCCCLLGFDG